MKLWYLTKKKLNLVKVGLFLWKFFNTHILTNSLVQPVYLKGFLVKIYKNVASAKGRDCRSIAQQFFFLLSYGKSNPKGGNPRQFPP